MRTFIAIELPEGIKDSIEGQTEKLKVTATGLKWVTRDNLHITLKFLGWVDEMKLKEIKKTVKKLGSRTSPFEIEVNSLGGFPSRHNPKILWAGIGKGREETEKFANELEEELVESGFEKEAKKFHAHVTLCRTKEKGGSMETKNFIKELSNYKFGSFWANSISIIKSTLKPAGPIYETLEKIKLK
ncbi:MAG: RNA 2',3'-cyclic phosphodiesterase [bacterium]